MNVVTKRRALDFDFFFSRFRGQRRSKESNTRTVISADITDDRHPEIESKCHIDHEYSEISLARETPVFGPWDEFEV